MSPFAMLLAQALDAVGVVVVILTVIVFLVSQVANMFGQQRGAGGDGPRPARRPQQADVEDEIGEFLRRAAQRSAGQPQSTARPLPPARMGKQLPVAEVVEEVRAGSRAVEPGDEPATLDAPPTLGPAAMPPTAAAGLAALFASAQTVRQAIIIHEILQRPEQRWQ